MDLWDHESNDWKMMTMFPLVTGVAAWDLDKTTIIDHYPPPPFLDYYHCNYD